MQRLPAGSGENSDRRKLLGNALAVGCFASICRDRLADKLLDFSRSYPEIDIGVHEMARGSLLPALRSGELTMAVLPGGEEPGTRSMQVWQDHVMVAMPRNHRLAQRDAVIPRDLVAQPCLVSRQQFGSNMHRFLAGLVLPQHAALDATILDIGPARLIEKVAEGAGVTLICESHVAHLGADVAVRPVFATGALFPVRAYWLDSEPEWPLSALIESLTGG